MSEQNLNDMSNALEKTVYVENGKLYDNDNNLIDIGNAKITLGSYVGTGVYQFNIQIPENQCFFIMLSGINGGLGDITNIFETGWKVTAVDNNGFIYSNGFVEQLYNTTSTGRSKLGSIGNNGASYAAIQRVSDGQNGQLSFTIAKAGNGNNIYNLPDKTYHYATIGV